MFDSDYTIYGIHATRLKYLVNDAKVFDRYIDVYMTAAAVGCLNNRHGRPTDSTDRARVYADAFLTESHKCEELFQTIILADTSKDWSSDERTKICFQYRDRKDEQAKPPISEYELEKMKEAIDLFNEYVLGGIDILYESFYSASINPNDAIDYAYKTVFDQRSLIESRNGELNTEELLRPEY